MNTLPFFVIEATDTSSRARTGRLHTDHGDIATPIFMPVGTVGSVKGIHSTQLIDDIHAQIILGNTYHLYLRPGTEILYEAGGLHQFERWSHPILTDSGGFQVFSLASIRKMTDEGVQFASHIDGRRLFFTPEGVMDIERKIGADIMMAFDECCPGTADKTYALASMKRTNQWLDRCIQRFDNTNDLYGYRQHLFPIVQGCVYEDLRKECAQRLTDLDRDGYAIGGLAVGEPTEVMYDMIDLVNDILPLNKPRYLMGVGTPWNILEGIERGVDMFDCVMPTRNGRNGMMFTWQGIINIKNKKWEADFSDLDPLGTSFVDHAYSKAYVRHLFHANELLAMEILSIHNLAFYLNLVEQARLHIVDNNFHAWKNAVLPALSIRL